MASLKDVVQQTQRMTKDRVSRIISQIGQAAGVVVRQDDRRTGSRLKYASMPVRMTSAVVMPSG